MARKCAFADDMVNTVILQPDTSGPHPPQESNCDILKTSFFKQETDINFSHIANRQTSIIQLVWKRYETKYARFRYLALEIVYDILHIMLWWERGIRCIIN